MTAVDARIRIALFLGVAIFIFVGPILRQAMGVHNVIFRQWTMFSQIGLGVHKVEVDVYMSGEWQPLRIDHAMREYRGIPLHAPLSISHQDGFDRLVDDLCVIYPGQRLRLTAQMATRHEGWKPVAHHQHVIC